MSAKQNPEVESYADSLPSSSSLTQSLQRLCSATSSHLLEALLYLSLFVAFQVIAVWTYPDRRNSPLPPHLLTVYFYARVWAIVTIILILPRLKTIRHGLARSIRCDLPLYVVLLVYVSCKALYVDQIPRWDAGVYFAGIQRLVTWYDCSLAAFVSQLRLGSHVSHLPAMYWAIGQMLSPDNHIVANIQNIIAAAGSIICFWLLSTRLFPSLSRIEQGLLLAAFAFNPLLFATSMTMNLDYTLVFCEILALVGFVYRRPVTFLFAAVGLCLSKEPGIALYGLLLAGILLFSLKSCAGFSPRAIVKCLLCGPTQQRTSIIGIIFRGLTVLLLPAPLVLFAWLRPPVHLNFWGSETLKWNTGKLLSFGIQGSNIFHVLVQATIINFSWIELLLVLVATAVLGWRKFFSKKPSKCTEKEAAVINTIGLMFVGFLVLNCLYINYWNPRYMAPVAPLLLLLMGRAAVELFKTRTSRIALLGLFVLAISVQNWRTIDPVSRNVVPRYSVGNTELLDLAGGLQSKADGMVYNAQFTNIQKLYEKISRRIFAQGARPVILWGFDHSWLIYFNHKLMDFDHSRPLLDNKTLRFTLKPGDTFIPTSKVFDQFDASNAPAQAVYIHLPWIDNEARVVEHLSKMYRVTDTFEESSGGFVSRVYSLERL